MNHQTSSSASSFVALGAAISTAFVPMTLAIGIGAAAIAAAPGEAQAQSWGTGFVVPYGSQTIGEPDIYGRKIWVTPGPLF